MSEQRCPPPVNICAAMMANRGIGKDGALPWPHLSRDFKYYIDLVTTPRTPGKYCLHIRGRVTYEDMLKREGDLPNTKCIVISNTLKSCPDKADYLVHSYEEAIQTAFSPPLRDQIDTVWVMGGTRVYQAALNSAYTDRLYLTYIHLELDSDAFFPDFSAFKRIKNEVTEDKVLEENGIQFEFQTYEKQKYPT